MSETNETIADIVAEMRKRDNLDGGDMVDNFHIEAEYGEYGGWDGLELIKAYADRIEAAACSTQKSENCVEGNASAMREALEKIAHYAEDICSMDDQYCADWHICADIARKALSTPPKNCDVGTAEEQAKRFQDFCDNSQVDEDYTSMCARCTLRNEKHCELAWTQMPYEKGEVQ